VRTDRCSAGMQIQPQNEENSWRHWSLWMYAKGTGLINYGTVSEISSYCWNVTQRWCVVSCRRFGTACLIFKVQSTKFFLDCLFVDCRNLEDGTDRLSRNVCNLTTNKHCVTSKNSADLIYIAAEARRHVVSALFCSVRWHASGPITYIAVLWLNARTSMLIQHTTTQPRIVIVWKWFASDAHTYLFFRHFCSCYMIQHLQFFSHLDKF